MLMIVLAGAAALVVFSDPPAPRHEVVSALPAIPAPRPAMPARTQEHPTPRLLDRGLLYPARANVDRTSHPNLLSGRSWAPPPPAMAPSPPPTPAPPPEFPFAYVGKQRDGHVWQVFLSKGNATFVLGEGHTVEQEYQVIKIAPPVLTMMYLPMRHLHQLAIGDAD